MKLLALALALCLATQAAHAQAVAGRPHLFTATAVGGTANAQTVTTGGGFNNVAMDIVCANFTTPNTGAAAVSVDGKLPALPVQRQVVPTGLVALGGGELTGYQCLQVNTAGTGFVLGGVTGGITVLSGAHPVTVAEWTYGQTFVCIAAGCNLTFPAVSTLPNQGGVNLATVGVQATLTPNAVDQINTGLIEGSTAAGGAVAFPADTQSLVVNGGANALSVPMGPVQYFPFAWLPGMDLSTATNGFGVGRTATPRTVYAIRCQNDVVSNAGSMQFYQQTASGLIGAGTAISSSFNMVTSAAGTESANLLTTVPTVVPANYWIGAKVTGGPITAGAGRCNVSFR